MNKTFIFCLILVTVISGDSPIKHIVVLMQENRSFDHLLGFMMRGGPFGDERVDGLTGKECNPKNISDPNSGKVCVNDQAKDSCPYDPDHSW